MDGKINDESYKIFMGDSCFESVFTDKSTRRDGYRFKVIVKMANDISLNAELKSLIQPLPGFTHVVMNLLG